MKTRIKTVDDHGIVYQALMFVCPGCVAGGPEGYDGIHLLPVNAHNGIGKPWWVWNKRTDTPTLSPSILTKGGPAGSDSVCHSFLTDGVFNFLSDCTHPLAGQHVPIPDLPSWAEELE